MNDLGYKIWKRIWKGAFGGLWYETVDRVSNRIWFRISNRLWYRTSNRISRRLFDYLGDCK